MNHHTPAPWSVDPEIAQIIGADGEPVCQFLWPTLKRDFAETRANAALVACAPIMLETLERISKWGSIREETAAARNRLSTYHALLKELVP